MGCYLCVIYAPTCLCVQSKNMHAGSLLKKTKAIFFMNLICKIIVFTEFTAILVVFITTITLSLK